MYAEARLAEAMDSMVRGIDAPPVAHAAIRARMSAPLATIARPRAPFARYALAMAAAIALFLAIFPRTSLAVLERFEHIVVDSYAAAYKVIGWTPPPPPKSLRAGASQRLSLAAAQAKEPFTIVVPAGVPSDARLTSVRTMPVLVYDKTRKRWSKGTPAIELRYKRSRNRDFSFMIEADDPRLGPTSKYIYEAEDLRGGKVELIKHERFQWRNVDQLMTAVEDDGISAAEIEAVRSAMHGEAIEHLPLSTIEKAYVLGTPKSPGD